MLTLIDFFINYCYNIQVFTYNRPLRRAPVKSTAKKPKSYKNPTTQFLGTVVAGLLIGIGITLELMSTYGKAPEEVRESIASFTFPVLLVAAAILLAALASTVMFMRREARIIAPPTRKTQVVALVPAHGRERYARTNTIKTI